MTIVNNQVTMYTNVTKHSRTLQKLYGLQYRNIHVHSHLPVFHESRTIAPTDNRSYAKFDRADSRSYDVLTGRTVAPTMF